MKTCQVCKKRKKNVARRLGLDARGIVQLDLCLCDNCATKLSPSYLFSRLFRTFELPRGGNKIELEKA